MTLFEREPDGTGFFRRAKLPLRVSLADAARAGSDARDLVPPGHELVHRPFETGGRAFPAGGVRKPTCAEELIDAVNQLLATLSVAAGDHYPEAVEPAVFADAPGWYTGASGRTPRTPDGEQTETWASTVPFRDELHSTLADLGDDDIVISVWLSRASLWPPTRPNPDFPPAKPPYRLDRFEV